MRLIEKSFETKRKYLWAGLMFHFSLRFSVLFVFTSKQILSHNENVCHLNEDLRDLRLISISTLSAKMFVSADGVIVLLIFC
jgi:hypothetical protein